MAVRHNKPILILLKTREFIITNTLQKYYQLTKPGIIYGNLITASAGFLLASKGDIGLMLLFETLAGISLVIASACVFNNYIDRGIDEKMARTKKRALVTHTISPRAAIFYSLLLGCIGFFILARFTNLLTVLLGLVAYINYIAAYAYAKRRSVHGTLVGSISGAIPPVAGYTAVTNDLDGAALILFLIMVFWQMPHFYSIGIYRLKDYRAAGLPILPVKKGIKSTKLQIMLYIFVFVLACVALSVFGYTGLSYLVVVASLGLFWLWEAVKGFNARSNSQWARQMFFYSLVITLATSIMLSLNSVLP